jgi:hypothetical protein
MSMNDHTRSAPGASDWMTRAVSGGAVSKALIDEIESQSVGIDRSGEPSGITEKSPPADAGPVPASLLAEANGVALRPPGFESASPRDSHGDGPTGQNAGPPSEWLVREIERSLDSGTANRPV